MAFHDITCYDKLLYNLKINKYISALYIISQLGSHNQHTWKKHINKIKT